MSLDFLTNGLTMLWIELLVLLVIGLAEIIKQAVGLNKKFIPLMDLVFALGLSFAIFFSEGWRACLILGIIIGLQACGLFSGVKNVIQGAKGET